MQLHPPALEGRHQGLDFMRLAHHGVPEQKAHSRTHHQHDEGTERAGFVLLFVIQVERRGHPAEHHEHLVEVADRDVPHIRANEVAFVPAHQRADEGHGHGHPRDARADHAHGVPLATREHADPVERSAHEEQHAHPQNGRLAGQEILETEHRLCTRQGARTILLIQADGHQRQGRHHQHQYPQRAPEPAQPDHAGHGSDQDAFFIHIHVGAVALKGVETAHGDQDGKQPVQPVAARQKAFVQGDGGGCGVHAWPVWGCAPISF